MQRGKTDTHSYTEDKPTDCQYCYFRKETKGSCQLSECYYLIREGKLPEESGQTGCCVECPYGKHNPCIGYCLLQIMQERKKMFRKGAQELTADTGAVHPGKEAEDAG